MAPRDALEIGRRRRRQRIESVRQKCQRIAPAFYRRRRDNLPQRSRRYREHPLAVAHFEVAAVANDLELSSLEQDSVLILEHRHQHRVVDAAFRRLPVDIEELCVRARRSVLEHVPPPRILARDRHVIRHDVEHLSHLRMSERVAHSIEPEIAAQLAAYLRVIDDVVAVSTAGRRLQNGRAIEVVDTQFFQVGNNFCRIVEAELAIELDAVSR